MKILRAPGLAVLAVLAFAPAALRAWNYPGHRMVNQIALASLPADFPEWARTPANAERIAFLSGEPDRWRNTHEQLLQHYNAPDHYIDWEQLPDAGVDPATLTPFRYDFTMQFSAGRAAHPDRFEPINPAKDADHTRPWPGFLPWAITEYYAKVQSGFSYLKALESDGTPEEIANARANIVYMMGVMGHYVGDGSQPLHNTVHHHGWVGPNPHGYTTAFRFHEWIDGGFIAKAGISTAELLPRVAPVRPLSVEARPDGRDPVFVQVVDYLLAQKELVEPLYQLEKAGKLKDGGAGSAEGRAFIDGQLLKAGQMLGALWLTAWRQAGPDPYLRADLLKRRLPAATPR